MGESSAEDLIKEALSLPENSRAKIAERLIASLHGEPSREVDEAWHLEMESRIRQIDSGEVQCIPWEEIRNRLYRNAENGN